jgi:uncharacterized protein YbjT (DUF2867 family)
MKKIVLVTGTSGGFGADIVSTLHESGHRVFASMRKANGTDQPADPDLGQEYGPTAALPNEITRFLGGFFQSPDSPKPHEVAQQVEKLIVTPDGRRPARVVVGAAFGADEANTALRPLQEKLLHGFGFDKLDKLNVQ